MLRKSIFFSIANSIIVSGGGLMAYSLLTKNLSTEEFGTYSLIVSILSFIIMVGCFGLNLVSSKVYEKTSDKNLHIVRIIKILIPSSFFSILTFTIIYFNSIIFKDSSLILFYLLCTIILVSIFLRTISDYFRSKNNLFKFFIYNSIASGAGIIFWTSYLIFLAVLLKNYIPNIENIFLVMSLCSMIPLIFFVVQNFKKINKKMIKLFYQPIKIDKDFKIFFFTTFGIFLVSALKVFKEQFSIWILGSFSTIDQVALFFVAYKSLFFLYVPLMLIDISIPQVISNSKISSYNYERNIRIISTLRFLIASVFLVFLFIFCSQIIELFFGIQYFETVNSFRFLLLSLIPYLLLGPCHSIMFLTEYDSETLKIDSYLLLPIIILSIFLTSFLGFEGAVISYGLYLLISNILYYIFVKIKFGINTLPYFNLKKAFFEIRKGFN